VAKLDVSGSFLITVGGGAGPDTWIALSVSSDDGNPKSLDFQDPQSPLSDQPVDVFVTLSAMFGAFRITLRIVEVQEQEPGFYALRVEGPSDLSHIELTRPSTLGIVVDDGTDRGQALACSCGAADVTPPFGERTQRPPSG
jgi:hypothetical protein